MITINAIASDSGTGVKNVTFWDGQPVTGTLIGTDLDAPYSITWDTTSTSDGPHNLYIRVFDFTGNYLNSSAVSIRVDNTPPTVVIQVPSSASGQITINVTSNEPVASMELNVTNSLGENTTISMVPITSSFWQGSFSTFASDNYTVYVEAFDYVNFMGIDTTTFEMIVSDVWEPNLTNYFSEPLGLLYITGEAGYTKPNYNNSAGLKVNITVQFDEVISLYKPFKGVWLNYSITAGTEWIDLPMRLSNYYIQGNYNITHYTIQMPAFRNGTTVLINIYAIDGANNTFDLQTKNSTNPYLEYLVIGFWIESFSVNVTSLEPYIPFEVNVIASLRNLEYKIQVNTIFYNPDWYELSSSIFSSFETKANMTYMGNFLYHLVYPTPEDLKHGQIVKVYLKIISTQKTEVQFAYNGSLVIQTENHTIGRYLDNLPPRLISFNLSSLVPSANEDIEIWINLTDDGVGIDSVLLFYSLDGTHWESVMPILYKGVHIAVIPKQNAGSTVQFYISATDKAGKTYNSEIYSITIALPNYNLYIFLITLMVAVIASMWIIRRRKKRALATLKGPERYKLIKQKY